jgi:hypothetical protein
MRGRRFHEALLMPWADLNRAIKVGSVEFRPWNPVEVRDEKIRDYLEQYFACHVDHCGRSCGAATLIGCNETFREFSRGELSRARSAVDALIVATICPQVLRAVSTGNCNIGPPTADRYQLVRQRFQPDEKDLCISVGRSYHYEKLSDQLRITAPLDMGSKFALANDDVLQALGRVISGKGPSDERKRIIRSLEWFRMAHTVGDEASELSAAVMMSTAFEILLEIPNGGGKTEKFIAEVEGHLKRVDSLQLTKPWGKKSKSYSLPGWWANDFYDLRSRVVHGDPVNQQRLRFTRWITHLIVADVVFWECLVRLLFARGLLGSNIRRNARMWDKVDPKQPAGFHEQYLLNEHFDFTAAHVALGWLPKPDRRRRRSLKPLTGPRAIPTQSA